MLSMNAHHNSGQDTLDQFLRLSNTGFSTKFLDLIICNFLAQLSEPAFWVTNWALAFNSNYFKGFLELSNF